MTCSKMEKEENRTEIKDVNNCHASGVTTGLSRSNDKKWYYNKCHNLNCILKGVLR